MSVTTGPFQRTAPNYLEKDNTTVFVPTGDYNPSTKKYVDDREITAGSYAAGDITLTKATGDVTIDVSALLDDTNDYVNSASFNTGTGVLTLTRLSSTEVTVDLDNRYLELTGGTLTGELVSRQGDAGSILQTENASAGNADQFFIKHNLGDTDIGNLRGDINITNGDVVVTGNVTGANLNISNWDTAYTHSQVTTGNPHSISVTDLTDTTISGIASGEILKWSGSAWINNTLAEAGISATGHTHTASNITDFDTEVANNTTVAANTSARHTQGTDTSVNSSVGSGIVVSTTGTLSTITNNSSNWDAAYDWGDHDGLYLPLIGGGTVTGSVTATGILQADELRNRTGQQLVLNVGESHAQATGQTAEWLYVNAEQGLEINTSPDNWATGWAGRNTSYFKGDEWSIDGETITKTNIQNFKTAYGWGDHAGLYDDYGSWNLKSNGTQRTTVTSGGTLDLVNGDDISIVYSAGGVMTIHSTFTETSHADVLVDGDFSANGLMKRTGAGTYTTITDSSSNWDAAYNDRIVSASFATGTGILTLTQQDAGTVTVDLDGRYLTSETDSQTLSWNGSTGEITISGGNTIDIDGRYLQSETSHADVVVDGDFSANGLMKRTAAGVYTTITDSSSNWDSAYTHSNVATGNPHSISVTDLTDTTISGIASGEILKWSGSAWINNTLVEAGIAAASHTHLIADITDFTDNSSNWDTAYTNRWLKNGNYLYHTDRVGIGISTPDELLEVEDTSAAIKITGTTGAAILKMKGSASEFNIISQTATNRWDLYDVTAAATRLSVSGSTGELTIHQINSSSSSNVLVHTGGVVESRTVSSICESCGAVVKTGTPLDNQIAVFTDADTVEGTTGLTYNGTALNITGNITLSGTVDGIDVGTDVAANTTHRGLTSGNPHSVSKSDVGLGSVENTALSTWGGSANLTTVGTIGTGTWQGTAVSSTYVGNLPTSKITSGTFADARISESSVTQHEAALTIAYSQLTGTPTIPVVEDTAYAASWDGDTDAASKNAIYDKIESLPDPNSRTVSVKTSSPYTILSSESGTHFVNNVSGGNLSLTLPTAAAGLWYEFSNLDSAGGRFDIFVNTGDQIVSTSGTATGYIRTQTQYSSIYLVAIDATNWMVVSATAGWSYT